nr:MAG TPA: hypothetical protein [Caudoviricetes sp.]
MNSAQRSEHIHLFCTQYYATKIYFILIRNLGNTIFQLIIQLTLSSHHSRSYKTIYLKKINLKNRFYKLFSSNR